MNDFRHSRCKLPPVAFALGPKDPDAPASDLIDETTWKSITNLPDDVSLRTSDHYGSQLRKVWSLWGEWTCLVLALQKAAPDPRHSPISYVACNVTDEFQASVYVALVGFYRLAFSSLRNVLEQITIGLYLTLSNELSKFNDWLHDDCDLSFGWAADQIRSHPGVLELERSLSTDVRDDLFSQRTPKTGGGLARRLFAELSCFTHGRPNFGNADLWQSNGPIFVPWGFEKWVGAFAKTYALAVLESKLAQPTITALASDSSSSIMDIYQAALDLMPQRDDGLELLKAVPSHFQ